MKKEVEFGIRVSVKESQAAAADLKEVGNAATKTAAQVDQAGRAMSSQLEAGAAAARNASAATAGMAAAQAAAAERVQATAAASQQQLGTATAQFTAAQAKAVEGLRVTNTQVKNVGISAAQTANALRGIPAQMTDIVTSLAAGQAPMTVLMQQGGQLKDMFGGIGPAAKALGGHIAGLITPFTVAATVAAVLAVSYNQGSKEADNYAKALIMTGNAAGSTVGQMQAMAGRIDGIIGTQAAAAAALTQMGETGRVASRNLEQFTTVALKMERDVGQPVEATVKQFAELGKAPVEASLKLNEQYRYLTATVYEQIRALQDQGRATDAAALAQTTFADAMAARASQIEGNLGVIERGWRAIKSTAKEAWDAMLNVGRQSSLESQLKSAADNVAALEAKLQERERRGRAAGDIAPKLAAAKALQATLQETLKLDSQSAAAAAERARAEEAGINFSKVLYEGRTKQQKLEADIAKVRADGLAAGKTEHEIQKAIGILREKYKESGSATTGQTELANLRARVQAEQQYLEQLKASGTAADKLNEGEKLALQYAEQLKGKLDGKTRARLKDSLAQAEALALTLKEQEAIKESAKATLAAAEAHTKYLATLASGLDKLKDQVREQQEINDRLGLGKEAIANLDAAKLEEQATTLDGMAIKKLDKDLDEAQYALYKAQAQELRKLASLKRDGAAKEVMIDQAKEAAEAWKKTNDDIGRSLTDSIMRGGKNAGEYLKDYFRTLVLRPVVHAIVQPMANSIASVFTGGQSGGAGGQSGGAGGAMNLFSMGKTMWQGFSSGGFSGLASSVGSMFGFGGTGMGLTGAASLGGSTSLASMGLAGGGMGAPMAASTASAGGAMSSIGSAFSNIPVVGWILAGMMSSQNWHKQGWDANNGSIGTVGKIAGPATYADQILKKIGISGSTAALLSGSGIHSRIWGRKNPEVESFGVQGDFSSTGFAGNEYVNILRKGGWLRSDKRTQQRQAVNADLQDTLDSGIQGLVAATKGFGDVLSIEADVIDGYTKSIKLNLDRDAAKSQEIITGLFTEVADELSARLAPTIADFATSGETAAVTLQRLAAEYTVVNDVLWTLGQTSQEAFGAVGLASMEMRNRLVEAAGGIDALSQGVAFYAANFLSQAEQLAPTMEKVAVTLTSIGATGVDVTAANARQQFRDFAESLDKTTEAGANAYATLLQLGPAFVTVSDYWAESAQVAAQVAEAAISQAQESARRTEEERARAIDTARSVLTAAYNREADALKSRIDRFAGAAKSLRTFLDSLQVGNLSTLSPAGKYFELKERFNRTYDLARSGDENAIGQLQDVSQQFLEASREYNASSQGYVEDFDRVRAALEATARTAMSQAGIAQEQLTQLQSSVQGLLDINQSVISVQKAIVELGAALTAGGQHLSAGAQSSVIESMYQSILGRSSDAAGKAYWENSLASGVPVEAIRTEFLNSQEYRGNQVEQLYQDILGRASETAGKEFWVNALNNGVSYESIRDQFLTSPEYLSLHGSHANGLRYVPFDGYRAELHRGERVLTEAEARRADASGGQTSVESSKQTDAIERQNGLLTELITVVQDGQDVSWKDMRKLRKQMARTLSQAVAA